MESDIISAVVNALVTGAVAAQKPTAKKVLKDAYDALKSLIQRKYKKVNLNRLERDPDSSTKSSIAADLTKAGAFQDQELLSLVRTLVEAVEQYDREAAAAVGVDIERVKAAFINIENVDAQGSGVKITDAEVSGGISISGIKSGTGDDFPKA